MLFLDQKPQCPWVSLFLRHAPSFPAFLASLIFLPQAPRTAQRGSVGTSHGWRELPQLEELWPPPPRLPGRCSSLKDVGMRCGQQAAQMKWPFFPSCGLISGLGLPTPASLPGSSGCLWLARQSRGAGRQEEELQEVGCQAAIFRLWF